MLSTALPKQCKDLLYTMFTATIYYICEARNDLKQHGMPKGWKTTTLHIKEYIRQRILYKPQHIRTYQNDIDQVLQK